MKLQYLYIIAFVMLFSCHKTDKKVAVRQTITEWLEQEIVFPADFQCNFTGKDTTITSCTDLLKSEYKILFYADSTGCTSCKLQLMEWQYLMETDSLLLERLSFLFFFHPKDKKELQFLFLRDNFNYPVFIDETNEINRLNNFPKEQQYQCFLLDKDNCVLAIGNPVQNPKIWELYKKIIKEKTLLD